MDPGGGGFVHSGAARENPPSPACPSRVEPTQEGDYEICFDNSFSRFSEKMVFFEVILEGQGGDVGGDEEWAGLEEPDASLLEYKLEDIRVSSWLCLRVNSRRVYTGKGACCRCGSEGEL